MRGDRRDIKGGLSLARTYQLMPPHCRQTVPALHRFQR